MDDLGRRLDEDLRRLRAPADPRERLRARMERRKRRQRISALLTAGAITGASVVVLVLAFREAPAPRPPGTRPTAIPKANGDVVFVRVVNPSSGFGEEDAPPKAELVASIGNSGDLRRLGTETAYLSAPSWSPDGSTLAFGAGVGIWTMPYAAPGDATLLVQCEGTDCYERSPAWSPDGSRIAFGSGDSLGDGLWTVDVESEERTILTDGLSVMGTPSWSPDGSRIAVIGYLAEENERAIHLIDARDGHVVASIRPQGFEPLENVSWSPDGQWLAFDGLDDEQNLQGVFLTTPAGDEVKAVRDCDTACMAVQPAWAPDGTSLIYTLGDCTRTGDCYSGDLVSHDIASTEERVIASQGLNCCAAWQPLLTTSFPSSTSSPSASAADSDLFGFGRLPLGRLDACPTRPFADESVAQEVLDVAGALVSAANGSTPDQAVVWASMDGVLKQAFGTYEEFRVLFDRLAPDAVWAEWTLANKPVRSPDWARPLITASCGAEVADASWELDVTFPRQEGLSGGAAQLFFVAKPGSGVRLWLVY